MPRPPNPDLEGEILDAAQKLWKKGGEKALTMRAVAKAAGTNTPSVYRRFDDRDDVLAGLLLRMRTDLAARLDQAPSVEEVCQRYLDYALTHPHEYALIFKQMYRLSQRRARRMGAAWSPRPARDVARRKLQEKLGGTGDHSERVLDALWMLSHGAALLLIDKAIPPQEAAEARKVFTSSVKALLEKADSL